MFSHLDQNHMPQMVDISAKVPCKRSALAQAEIELNKDILCLLEGSEIFAPKGAVFHTAILAGIQAVKQTSQLIPLCHPIPLSACNIHMEVEGSTVRIFCKVSSHYATGVEIEAITGASIAAITIYDMCKGINSAMTITNTKLLEKHKGNP